jgi:osmotically inducible lipoprotein OsmB
MAALLPRAGRCRPTAQSKLRRYESHTQRDMMAGRMSHRQECTMRRRAQAIALALLVSTLACCGGMSVRDRDTLIGAGVGAGVGAAVTNGDPVGTVGGAAVGGVIGNQVGRH